jgi:predicted PurR-regulated permease PerM
MKKTIAAKNKERERRARRKLVQVSFFFCTSALCVFLLWKLKAMLLPIVVGALLAYLFRPVKDRFRVSWLPHELRVLTLFAGVGLAVFMAVNQARKMIPDERQKLEFKVRLKYKVNEKFQEIVGTGNAEKRSSPAAQLISKEIGPAMDQLNKILDLDPARALKGKIPSAIASMITSKPIKPLAFTLKAYVILRRAPSPLKSRPRQSGKIQKSKMA